MPNDKKNQPDWNGLERRRHKRIKKNFILTYFDKNKPEEKFELTQLKDISCGGLRFVTTKRFTAGTLLGVELKTPYISETTYLEGEILECSEKIKDMLYEIRLKFTVLNTQAEITLTQLMEYFETKEKEL